MSMLAALVRAYDRLPDAPPFGYSLEKIGCCVVLNPDGSVADVVDLRDTDKKRSPKMVLVPQAKKRTVGIDPNALWDKTAYVLGVTAGEGKRTADEHAAFKAQHLKWLAESADEGLIALRRFLENWTPEAFLPPLWKDDDRDQNLVFRLEGEFAYLHDRPAARELWRRIGAEGASDSQICLVTGQAGPIARLHPSIKGVWGAQSSGASLISFNLDSFTSYGHEQGDNAPISEAAAFAYTTALNHFLADENHRLQIGDASTTFWADSEDRSVAEEADGWGAFMLGDSPKPEQDEKSGADEQIAEAKIQDKLLAIRDGKPLTEIAPQLAKGVRFYVLGLSPNAARVSVRFYWEDSFSVLVERYAAYLRDVGMEPAPERPIFSIRAAALRSAPARLDKGVVKYDAKAISSLLAGELTRAILSGGRFPRGLLSLLLLRVRSDHVLDRIRISLIKGLIIRDMRLDGRLPKRPDGSDDKEYLMRPDPEDRNPARRLGRLFALIERAQRTALGDGINVTVADKFMGSAASTPGRVFPMLLKNARPHLARLRRGHSDASWIKDAEHARRVAAMLDRDIGLLWGETPEGAGAPMQHSLEEQGLFFVGYYQERYRKRSAEEPDAEPAAADADNEEQEN